MLDTNAWLWWVSDPGRLSRRAARAVQRHIAEGLRVSVVSAWEVALKHKLGKLELDREVRSWLQLAARQTGVQVVPLSFEVALESTLLPEPLHRDPADRFILALTRQLGATLVTSDKKLLEYPHVRSIW